ncbi:MAG: RluA family pseudouridine synthase [Marinifilaceae bacterium]|jgi:23S rRNA pseudouridine1911/1915/1917 synthase|nr:RluA family pseudouridine synthase [Marinifilaceae bacterium]
MTKKENDIIEEVDDRDENNMYEHFRVEVDPGQALLRIDKFLNDRMPNTSRSKIQDAADNGNVMVNGEPVKSNYKVKPLDVITIELSFPKREITIIPQDIPLDIVYEDDQLIVVNKPAGLVVHPSYGHYSGTLVNALAWHLKDNPIFKDETDPRPGLVHRIDKNTSGLLVIAKTDHAKTHLGLQFFNKTSKRKYVALCWGNLKEESGTIIGNIGRNFKNRKIMDVFPEGGEYGKHAVTHYKVLERLGYVNKIECVLETGRTHQIRAHFKSIGHPLFNDIEYGGDLILKGTTFTKYKQFVQNCFKACPRHALHAKTLGFIHPTTGEEMLFNSEIPDDMNDLFDRWRNYIANRN